MAYTTTVRYRGGPDEDKDDLLTKLAEPGECIGGGTLLIGSPIRDLQYEFDSKAERDAANKRFAKVPWVLNDRRPATVSVVEAINGLINKKVN